MVQKSLKRAFILLRLCMDSYFSASGKIKLFPIYGQRLPGDFSWWRKLDRKEPFV